MIERDFENVFIFFWHYKNNYNKELGTLVTKFILSSSE